MFRRNKCPQPNYPPTIKGYRWTYNQRLNIWEEKPYDGLSLNDIRILNGLPPVSNLSPQLSKSDKIMKEILADVAGMTVNDTMDSIITHILFGKAGEYESNKSSSI